MLLLTDKQVVGGAMHFLEAIAYSACAVVALNIWGYQAFGEGVDLLKVYLGVLTYTLNTASDSIRFLVTMIVNRPYNLGDILILDADQISGGGGAPVGGVGSDLYLVDRINTGYTTFDGSRFLQVPNAMVVRGKSVRNASVAPYSDSMAIEVPICAEDGLLARVAELVSEYARSAPYQIDPRSSIRCVWGSVDGATKTIHVHWKYAPVFYDVSTAKAMMCGVRNYVVSNVWKELSDSGIVFQTASGGAFNAGAKYRWGKQD